MEPSPEKEIIFEEFNTQRKCRELRAKMLEDEKRTKFIAKESNSTQSC